MLVKWVIYHDEFGVSWSTGGIFEAYPEPMQKRFATDKAIVKAIRRKDTLTPEHPAILALVAWVKENYPEEYYDGLISEGNLMGLRIRKVVGPYKIADCDGIETVYTIWDLWKV